MRHKRDILIVALVAVGAAVIGAVAASYFVNLNQVELAGGLTRNELLSLNAPSGTLTKEENAAYKGSAAPTSASAAAPGAGPAEEAGVAAPL